jgi:hypothetical protein
MLRTFKFNAYENEFLNLFCAVAPETVSSSSGGSQDSTLTTNNAATEATAAARAGASDSGGGSGSSSSSSRADIASSSGGSQDSLFLQDTTTNDAATEATEATEATAAAQAGASSSSSSRADIASSSGGSQDSLFLQDTTTNDAATEATAAAPPAVTTVSAVTFSAASSSSMSEGRKEEMKQYFQFDMRVVYARHLAMIVKAPASLLLSFSARYHNKEDNWKFGAHMIAFDCVMSKLLPGETIPDSFLDGTPEDPILPGDPRYIRDYLPYYLNPLPYTNTRTYLRTITHLQSNNFTHDEIVKELAPAVFVPTNFWARATVDVGDIDRLRRSILKGCNVTDRLLYHGNVLSIATALQNLNDSATSRSGIVTRSNNQYRNNLNGRYVIVSSFLISVNSNNVVLLVIIERTVPIPAVVPLMEVADAARLYRELDMNELPTFDSAAAYLDDASIDVAVFKLCKKRRKDSRKAPTPSPIRHPTNNRVEEDSADDSDSDSSAASNSNSDSSEESATEEVDEEDERASNKRKRVEQSITPAAKRSAPRTAVVTAEKIQHKRKADGEADNDYSANSN